MSLEEKDFSEHFFEVVGKPCQPSVPLMEHAHFRIGGNADYFFKASSVSELVSTVKLARTHSIPYFIMGGGNNLLFDDKGFRGLIIKNVASGLNMREAEKVEALSGTSLEKLLQFCTDHSLTGFEFLAGIPGTVGGAVYGNAGAFSQSIGSFMREAFLLGVKDERVKVGRSGLAFDYRKSRLRSTGEILLEVVFDLEKGIPQDIRAKMAENIRKRKATQPPWRKACAGSYFKNPVLPNGKRVAAAYLLDQVGAKDLKRGGAAVFEGHANFIINRGQASSEDVLGLASELKRRVKQKFGVELEEEVIYLPAEPSTY